MKSIHLALEKVSFVSAGNASLDFQTPSAEREDWFTGFYNGGNEPAAWSLRYQACEMVTKQAPIPTAGLHCQELAMIFHISFQYTTDKRDEVHERFKATGAPPPKGVIMTGRWHSASGNRGFLVAEAAGAEAIAGWLQEWTELVSFEVVPVLTDAEFRDVLA